jgi:hypothetical protein
MRGSGRAYSKESRPTLKVIGTVLLLRPTVDITFMASAGHYFS